MRQTTLTQSGALDRVIAGKNSHNCIQYMDYIEMFQISLDSSSIYLLVLVDV